MSEGAKEYLDEHKGETFSILSTPSGGMIVTPQSSMEVNINDMETNETPLGGEKRGITFEEYKEMMKKRGFFSRQEGESDPLAQKTEPDRAVRDNAGKPRWSLIPYEQMEPVVRVLEWGARKYGDFNWQKKMDPTEILESAQRHTVELFKGNMLDKQTQLHHAAHIISNMLFYMYHTKEN